MLITFHQNIAQYIHLIIYLFQNSYFILLILQLLQFKTVNAFCQTGCKCWDNLKKVECRNITMISILFHPMLKNLNVRNSPNLKLDPVSIGLYQGKKNFIQEIFFLNYNF